MGVPLFESGPVVLLPPPDRVRETDIPRLLFLFQRGVGYGESSCSWFVNGDDLIFDVTFSGPTVVGRTLFCLYSLRLRFSNGDYHCDSTQVIYYVGSVFVVSRIMTGVESQVF